MRQTVKIFIVIIALFLVITEIVLSQAAKNQSPITIINAWFRPAAEGANTALFFEVVNKSDKADTLLSAKSNLAKAVEIHETYSKGNDMMGMRKVEFVVIPPNSTVKFKPRDLHVMLLRLNKNLKIGNEGEVELNFKNVGKVKVKGIVREMQPMKR